MGPAAVGERSLATVAAERHARAAAERQRAFAAGAGAGGAGAGGRAARFRGGGGGGGGGGGAGTGTGAGAAVSVVPAYKSARRLSNKKLLRNALSHVCLAGAAMSREKEAALAALDAVPDDAASVFVILFRGEVTDPHSPPLAVLSRRRLHSTLCFRGTSHLQKTTV